MKFRKKRSGIALILAGVLMLVSCNGSDGKNASVAASSQSGTALLEKETAILKKVNNSDKYDQLITNRIDINFFVQTFDSDPLNLFHGNSIHISQVADTIGLQCLRQKSDGTLYSVHQVKQGGLLYIFYNQHDTDDPYVKKTVVRNWYYVKKDLQYEDFSAINIGDNMKKVQSIDPATSVYINRLNDYGDPSISSISTFHYLKDGILYFYYEKSNHNTYTIHDIKFDPNFYALTYCESREELIDGEVFPMDRIPA